ncbi:bifunctional (p)ppGpp synthetase/guanosine-3',5'-bis(diphosphate) 3'-pyrophosphohydrolase [Patescibacteria group bacterium]|nr:MAG: bifunctional (p)ppGpp synthetase/guanosine-3',5'-bis(diphosphate) 3'-pyrophosphohydrolase [Patescibacteria group bacterium]
MPNLDDIFNAFRLPLTPARKKLITEAFEFAKQAHAGQKRKSGEDYIIHPIETAIIIAGIGMGSKTVSAGLLHDVPEDTTVTLKELEKKFGPEIATLVDGITKLGKIKLRGEKEENYLENLRKMFLAMAADIRVVIIKLADRLHNMRTLGALPLEKQERIARETMEIFAPIANRLGIGEIKGELEDLSFKHLDAENYALTQNLSRQKLKEGAKFVELAIAELRTELKQAGIDVKEIGGRAKHIYRLFRKLQTHDMDINRIYDLVAIRVIVPEVADCYETLGIVHKKYHPMVGRIKDYISLPKPNGYQSIHTTVFGPEGKIIEVQIRTQQMHIEAEFGIAAHWFYSERTKGGWKSLFQKKKKVPEKELRWVQQLREWQHEIGQDDDEFVRGLKIEFFKNHIFAFTPKGDIINLPEESSMIDFAYAIHSQVGDHATGAKADGKMVPLHTFVRNGQVIEILTSKDRKGPSQDWLTFSKTSAAKSHIRKFLKLDLPTDKK